MRKIWTMHQSACVSDRLSTNTAARWLWPPGAGKATGMTRSRLAAAVLLMTALAMALPQVCGAQDFASGRTVTIQTDLHKFPQPVKHCLAMCVELVVERREFECAPFIAPPPTGCDLPWITPEEPNPVPPGFEDQCIPEKGELAGYDLLERAELVERHVMQHADCTSTVTKTVLQQLPLSGNSPRPCPDPGPWLERNEILRTIQFHRCP